jgi:hypothetical protein
MIEYASFDDLARNYLNHISDFRFSFSSVSRLTG